MWANINYSIMESENASNLIYNGGNTQIKNLTPGKGYLPMGSSINRVWVKDDKGRKRPFAWGNFEISIREKMQNLVEELHESHKNDSRAKGKECYEMPMQQDLPLSIVAKSERSAFPDRKKRPFVLMSRKTWPRWMQLAVSAPGLGLLVFVTFMALAAMGMLPGQ